MAVAWLEPWEPVEDRPDLCRGWEEQLVKEVGPGHVLFGKSVRLIARRFDCDDALFALADGGVAFVHLAWRATSSPDWPAAELFPSLEAWAERVMKQHHADWIA
jgi:hypothetical protein